MNKFLIPQNKRQFVYNGEFKIQIPKGGVILVEEGQNIQKNDFLANIEFSRVLSRIPLTKSFLPKVLDGEYVSKGDLLGIHAEQLFKKQKVFSKTSGIIEIDIVSEELRVVSVRKITKIRSEFSGCILNIDSLQNIIKVQIRGCAFVPWCVSDSEKIYSGIIDSKLNSYSSILYQVNFDKNLLKKIPIHKRLVIFNSLVISDLKQLYEVEGRQWDFIVLSLAGKQLERNLVKSMVGSRVFVQNGYIVYSSLRCRPKEQWFSTVKVGGLVDNIAFNNETQSCKIKDILSSGQITLKNSDSEVVTNSYLNLRKK